MVKPGPKSSGRDAFAEKRRADLGATRTVGAVLLLLGTLLSLPAFFVVWDLLGADGHGGKVPVRALGCSLVLGVPLTVTGLLRVLRPERYQGAAGDLD
jgi:uncharacterized membrane protein